MSDDLDPDVQQLVNLARKARTPGAKDQLRMAERLAVPLAASAALGTAVGAAKAAGVELASAGAKVASGTLLGGLGAKLVAVAVVGVAASALFVSQHTSKQSLPAPAPSHQVTSAAPTPPPAAPQPDASAVAQPPAEAVAEPDASDTKAIPKPNSSSGVHSAKHADELTEEASLLHEAQTAWRAGQSAQALRLANQHAQRFPHSQLANERDVLRVLSLCKLGQIQAAKQVGARLLRSAQGSPWYQSVADSCAGN